MSWVGCFPSPESPLPMTRRLSAFHSPRSSTAPKNQAFEVPCACGETLTGTRQTQPQTLPCPHCGAPVFVLPLDCYGSATRQTVELKAAPAKGAVSRGMIAKLNHLAFWTRIREKRTQVGGRLKSAARNMGQWFKRRLNSLRLW